MGASVWGVTPSTPTPTEFVDDTSRPPRVMRGATVASGNFACSVETTSLLRSMTISGSCSSW